MDRKRVGEIAYQVRRYIERVWPQMERAGGTPETPMDRKAKGKWNPPVGTKAHLVMDANRDAATIIGPALEELRRQRVSFAGHEFRDILSHAAQDSASFARALAENYAYRRAFRKLSWLVAMSIVVRYPDIEIKVVTDPSKEDEPVGNPNNVSPRWRTITAQDAYRRIVERLEAIRREHPDATEAACESILSERLEKEGHSGSIGRIRDAKAAVRKEKEGYLNGGDNAA